MLTAQDLDEIRRLIRQAVLARLPAGTLAAYAGATVPEGWLDCDGAAVSRTTYGRLFDAIGTTWGTGNGSTTFNVPDLRGRAVIGVGTGTGLTARALADTGGAETVALVAAEMPAHTHNVTVRNTGTAGTSDPQGSDGTGATATVATSSAGSGTAHQNMPPFAAARWMIKT